MKRILLAFIMVVLCSVKAEAVVVTDVLSFEGEVVTSGLSSIKTGSKFTGKVKQTIDTDQTPVSIYDLYYPGGNIVFDEAQYAITDIEVELNFVNGLRAFLGSGSEAAYFLDNQRLYITSQVPGSNFGPEVFADDLDMVVFGQDLFSVTTGHFNKAGFSGGNFFIGGWIEDGFRMPDLNLQGEITSLSPPVPEPISLGMLLLGFFGFIARHRL